MTTQRTTRDAPPVISPPYRRFAAAYASGAERDFSQAMARFALQQTGTGRSPCRSVLDVACGIGAACEFFATGGLRTTGVDISADMLERARAAAKAKDLAISYVEQDMRHLAVPERVDLVTCMYDSVNFMITSAELRAAFHGARNALLRGGRYVFDMYTITGLARAWGSADEIHTVHPEHFVASRTAWDPTTSINTKTIWGFDRADSGWQHWQERHTIRAYPLDEVAALLRAVGFEISEIHGWTGTLTSPVTDETPRIVIVATAS